mmetsp:Transcript_32812/g.79844  ORF Transcript_32812/g.79844 Transcript_32812/m.79844 type:complete len:145 (+) Transcript_32812:42-476(+)
MSACQLTKLSPQSQLNQPVSQQEQNRQQTAPRPRLDIQSQPLRPPKLEHQTTHLPLDEALYFRTSAPPSGCGKFRTGCPKSHATVARLSNRIKTLGKPESQCKKNLLTCKAVGDVHMKTWKGRKYNYQGQGEHILHYNKANKPL